MLVKNIYRNDWKDCTHCSWWMRVSVTPRTKKYGKEKLATMTAVEGVGHGWTRGHVVRLLAYRRGHTCVTSEGGREPSGRDLVVATLTTTGTVGKEFRFGEEGR